MLSVVVGQRSIWVEVPVVGLVVQHVPHGDEQFARHGDEDFHFVFPADLGLMVGEPAEEAALRATRAPCALDKCLSQERVAVGDSA